MNGFYFTFRSVTAAQRAQQLLQSAGISAGLLRTPAQLAVNGCGYCLRVGTRRAGAAMGLLQGSGLRRCYLRGDGGFTEVDCDLL